jgi:flagellar motor switch/type III secretory pathway protein FliN
MGQMGQQMGQVNPQQMTQEQLAYQQHQQQLAYQHQQQQQQQQQIARQSVQVPPQVVGEEVSEPMNKVNKPVEVKSKSIMGIKSKFGDSSGNNSNIKETIIVVLLFVVLNSKLIWKQLMKLPFMGTVEPSIIALIVNSLLAGIIYFVIKKFLLPK